MLFWYSLQDRPREYFHPENMNFNCENKYVSGWPKQWFLAEISVRWPRKLLIFTILKKKSGSKFFLFFFNNKSTNRSDGRTLVLKYSDSRVVRHDTGVFERKRVEEKVNVAGVWAQRRNERYASSSIGQLLKRCPDVHFRTGHGVCPERCPQEFNVGYLLVSDLLRIALQQWRPSDIPSVSQIK